MSKICVHCDKTADGECEACGAPLCAACDSDEFEDVMVCEDVEACEERCDGEGCQ